MSFLMLIYNFPVKRRTSDQTFVIHMKEIMNVHRVSKSQGYCLEDAGKDVRVILKRQTGFGWIRKVMNHGSLRTQQRTRDLQ
jgi:hypothetical protein